MRVLVKRQLPNPISQNREVRVLVQLVFLREVATNQMIE